MHHKVRFLSALCTVAVVTAGATQLLRSDHASAAQRALPPVLIAQYRGGFTVEGADARSGPSFLIDANRRLYTPGAITLQYPGPAILPYSQTTLSAKQLATMEKLAKAAGLDKQRVDWGTPGTADVPELAIKYKGKLHVIYSFGVGEEGLKPTQRTARQRVKALLDAMSTTAGFAGPLYRPTSLVITARETRPEDTPPDLQVQQVNWPTAVPPLSGFAQCGVLEGNDAAAALTLVQTTNELTQYKSNGKTYRVFVRAALPGDGGCNLLQ
jgi:hypothetical protein